MSISAGTLAETYARWGKGIDPVGLTFGDCFALRTCDRDGIASPLVRRDFSNTNLKPALPPVRRGRA